MNVNKLSTEQPKRNAHNRKKIGLILLSTDLTAERDFFKLKQRHANGEKVDIFVNRISFENPMTPASLRDILPKISETVAQILPGEQLDVVIFHCTSASALLGDEEITKAVHAIQPNAIVLTTASASAGEIRDSGCNKISVLAPYSLEVSQALCGYFESRGLEVLSLSYLDMLDDCQVARLDPSQISIAALTATDAGADALFISCTATPVLDVLPSISNSISRPCFASNQAAFTQIMKAVGLA